MITIARKIDRLLRGLELSRAVTRSLSFDDLGRVLNDLSTLEGRVISELGQPSETIAGWIEGLRERVEDARNGLLFEARYVEKQLQDGRLELEQSELPLELVRAQRVLGEELANAVPSLYGSEAELVAMESAEAAFCVESLREAAWDLLKLLGGEVQHPLEEPEARWPESEFVDTGFGVQPITTASVGGLEVTSLEAFLDAASDEPEIEWPDELEQAVALISDQLHILQELGGDSDELEEALDKVWDGLLEAEEALNAELSRRMTQAQFELDFAGV